jgi:DNA helicase MCM9
VTFQDGETVLAPGSLVLADRSLCTIDEFNALQKSDFSAMHEALEQQTVSAAKAGIVGRLNARCTVLAACNPKKPSGSGLELPVVIGITDALLSRFDLVMALPDKQSAAWDPCLRSLQPLALAAVTAPADTFPVFGTARRLRSLP